MHFLSKGSFVAEPFILGTVSANQYDLENKIQIDSKPSALAITGKVGQFIDDKELA